MQNQPDAANAVTRPTANCANVRTRILCREKGKSENNMAKNNFHDSVLIKGANCAFCGKTLDATSGIDAPRPEEGDFSLCFYCGFLMVFSEGDALRAATAKEREDFAAHSPREYELSKRLRRIYPAKRSALHN